ncbi:MAG TPA: ankyrin repeat domain-containing protein [Leptospiraceae bacterium]|nr:ankyrin repeat domain-containing protein [Leptospiraceae bacterium]HNH07929.1 ankyrin repeat domain-containing protein [Leptospiraceae bacterium]HNO23752.1 ankyrin repeat domain-containing protein [Leptospiraceae bacterium]
MFSAYQSYRLSSVRFFYGAISLLLISSCISLHDPVMNGDMNSIKYMSEHGYSEDEQNEAGETPIFIAAWRGDANIVKYLIKRGASLNWQDREGWTALHWAAGSGNQEIVRILIENGAKVNVRNKYHYTPLHGAASLEGSDTVKYLTEHGADVNVKNLYGWTALQCASAFGRKETAEYLIAHGADPEIRNDLEKSVQVGNRNTADKQEESGLKSAGRTFLVFLEAVGFIIQVGQFIAFIGSVLHH